MAVLLEQGVQGIVHALFIQRLDVHLAPALAQHVDDLELQDARGVGAQRAAALEAVGLFQDGEKGLRDHVLRQALVAQLRLREAQQRSVQVGQLGFQAHGMTHASVVRDGRRLQPNRRTRGAGVAAPEPARIGNDAVPRPRPVSVATCDHSRVNIPPALGRAACARCLRPQVTCLCALAQRTAHRTEVLVLQHPHLLALRSAGKPLPPVYLTTGPLQALREQLVRGAAPTWELVQDSAHRDPVGGTYAGRWLAALAPVMTLGHDSGWVVLVQERADEALAPIAALRARQTL